MINTVTIGGNLGADPEVKTASSGRDVVRLRLANNEFYKLNGESQKKTHWVNIVCFNGVAEACKRLKKGSRVAIQGSLNYNEWRDSDGNSHSRLEVKAQNVMFMSPQPTDETFPTES